MSDKEENANAAPPTAANTVAAQLGKLRDANLKYKNLLKLAKDRIQQQEDDLKKLKSEFVYTWNEQSLLKLRRVQGSLP